MASAREHSPSRLADLNHDPLPPRKVFRIPLLSFFASLLSLDDKTLSLLTRPTFASDSSPLFSGPQLFIEYDMDDTERAEDKQRRKRLLGESESDVLKKGVDAACDSSDDQENRFLLPLPSIPLWSFVSSVCRARHPDFCCSHLMVSI